MVRDSSACPEICAHAKHESQPSEGCLFSLTTIEALLGRHAHTGSADTAGNAENVFRQAQRFLTALCASLSGEHGQAVSALHGKSTRKPLRVLTNTAHACTCVGYHYVCYDVSTD